MPTETAGDCFCEVSYVDAYLRSLSCSVKLFKDTTYDKAEAGLERNIEDLKGEVNSYQIYESSLRRVS